MARKYIIDTHALIWYLEGNPRLGIQAQAVMSEPESVLVLPVIALAEAVHIVAKGRTSISSVVTLMAAVQDAPHLEIASLTWEIVQQSLTLTAVPEIHDRLIVATAVYLQGQGHEVLLLTRDEEMQQSGVVPVIWQ
ncbi:MAG: PIN domain-containing protein [Anaerolinea sp.]|nr:PIN domain-containing protein [Anaerolinea sp.]